MFVECKPLVQLRMALVIKIIFRQLGQDFTLLIHDVITIR